jgi:hypothetical protein
MPLPRAPGCGALEVLGRALLLRLAGVGHGLHTPVTGGVGRGTTRGGFDLSGDGAHGEHKCGEGHDGTDYVLHHPISSRAQPLRLNSLRSVATASCNPGRPTPIPCSRWLESAPGVGRTELRTRGDPGATTLRCGPSLALASFGHTWNRTLPDRVSGRVLARVMGP